MLPVRRASSADLHSDSSPLPCREDSQARPVFSLAPDLGVEPMRRLKPGLVLIGSKPRGWGLWR